MKIGIKHGIIKVKEYAMNLVGTLLAICKTYFIDIFEIASHGKEQKKCIFLILKRTIDLILSFIGLIIFAPVILTGGLMVKLNSPGPMFYRQKRTGKDGKLFIIYKIRTMINNAEAKTGPIWAKKNDSRIVKWGDFLRKYHIDELPQILNILKGEMSFVGPRPERPEIIEKFKQDVPNYYKKLKVKPGLTGYAQVRYKYDETIRDVKVKIRYELFYIERLCLLLDFKILVATLRVLMLGKDEYTKLVKKMHKKQVVLTIIFGVIYFGIVAGPLIAREPEALLGVVKNQERFFYILGPEDVIRITVLRHPEMSGEVTVASDGTINLPLTGDVIRVGDLTKEEAAGELTKALSNYIKAPWVTVTIVAYNSKVYYVLGEVGRPGKFSMKQTAVTLRDAIINAGLPTNSAALGSVHIITPDPENPTYTIVNAKEVLYDGRLKHNILIKPDDVIYMPKNLFDKTTDILRKVLGPAQAIRATRAEFLIPDGDYYR